jgi:ABC-type sugar transport system ATPase subunit
MSTTALELKNVSNNICENIYLNVNKGEFLVLFGANGAGKTTLLNIIAGLTSYEGNLHFNNSVISNNIGYVFQNLNLFPHLTVFSNIAFGLKMQGKDKNFINKKVHELLQLLKIDHLSFRYPKNLSGGEKQRTAIARALAVDPDILLLDEPLNSLDLQTAKYFRTEFKQLQKKLGITTIYVTHNLEEAEELADRIAIMVDGEIEQIGQASELFFKPKTKNVSNLIGTPNIILCEELKKLENGLAKIKSKGLDIIIPYEGNKIKGIALFPGDIYVSDKKPPGADVNRFLGKITAISISDTVRLDLQVKNLHVTAEVPIHIYENLNLDVGQNVFLIFKLRKIKIFS